jgi:hypothetical protein
MIKLILAALVAASLSGCIVAPQPVYYRPAAVYYAPAPVYGTVFVGGWRR